METIDSNEKLVPGPEIITRLVASESYPNTNFPNAGYAMAAVAQRISAPSADIQQVRNTVFLSFRGKKTKSKDMKYLGEIYNIDTTPNFETNFVRYIGYLQRVGCTHYTAPFGRDMVSSFLRLQDFLKTASDSRLWVGLDRRDATKAQVFVRVGKRVRFPLVPKSAEPRAQ